MTDAVNRTGVAPWASFCMSTYKRPAFLEAQLSGILQQTFTNFDVIISDNDPDASGKAVVDKFKDDRIKYQVNPVNLGMVKSFNASLSRATGEFIVMITDDDPVYPDMLRTLFDLFQKYPGYGVYHGGCEILCHTVFSANVMRAKVGVNSCLSQTMDVGAIKVYSAQEFPYLFFQGKLGSLMLWSVAAVRREILIQHGGMPDYGTEFFTDHAYTVANCSHSGMVYINKALGHQAIHGDNFGFNQLKNLEKYKAIPDKFSGWVESHLGAREDWQLLKNEMHDFIGRAMVEFSLFIKKSLAARNYPDGEFETVRRDVFKKPSLKRWTFKYMMLSRYPTLFDLALKLKKKLPAKR